MNEDPFVAHRGLLFTVAYEMLGSAADAEDVLQESWLRWADVDHSQVRDPRRAVFVLREVFEMPYGEIAEAIGKSAATVRQIARRAREHVAARRPRVRVSRSEQQAVVERFLAALRTGRLQELMEVMAPDVVLIADGGGLAAAARAPIHGAELVGRLLARADRVVTPYKTTTVWLNGAPAGRVTRIYAVANPRKLTRLDEPAHLTR
jgi:DNA-binding Lrp family transcriptional regulator